MGWENLGRSEQHEWPQVTPGEIQAGRWEEFLLSKSGQVLGGTGDVLELPGGV